MAKVINDNLSDERMNFDKLIDGVVMAFADLGFWNGRRQGYTILGHNINGIFSVSEDENEWYGDGFNIRGSLSHHDGTHYVLYRVAKDIDEAERIGELIYNREIDEVGFRKKTRSLYPYVAEIYGWKTEQFGTAFEKAVRPMKGFGMDCPYSLCFHEGLRNPSWEPCAVSSFYNRNIRPVIRNTPFYDIGFFFTFILISQLGYLSTELL